MLDERKARRFAERLELPLTGTLGLLLLAKEAGLIESVAHWTERLRDAGLYFRADLVKRVLVLAGELPV